MKVKEGASAMEGLRTEQFSRRVSQLWPSVNTAPPLNLSVARQVRVVLRQSSASVWVPHSQDSYYCPLSPPNKVHSPQRGRRGDQDCPQLSREKRRPGEAVAPQLLVHSGPMHASVTRTFTFLRPWCRTGTLAQLSARQ